MTSNPPNVILGYANIEYLSYVKKHTVAQVCCTDERTVRRWRNKGTFPKWARKLVELQAGQFYQDRDIDYIQLPWDGWDGVILAPDGIQCVNGHVHPRDLDLLLWKAAFYDRGHRLQYDVKPY